MRFGYREDCLYHDTGPRHPESPDRLRAIRRRLSREHGVEYVDGDPAAADELAAVHDDGYVEQVREFCANGGGEWDADTVAVKATWDAALSSAGLARWAAESAIEGADGRDTPFSIGRPPGHHAISDNAMGFCFFNNVAVAARAVIDAGPADRVAVFDWDVHHGNGTQEIFYDQADVHYCSIHEQGLYPGTGEIDETGTGDGAGTTVNVPLPAGSGDAEYLATVEEVVAPCLEAFDPDLLLVSAGFDAHRHDPISRMRVSTEGYGLLTDRMRDLADGVGAALGFVLEGGYSLDTLADSVRKVHDVFDGYEPADPEDEETSDSARSILDDVREVHGLGEK